MDMVTVVIEIAKNGKATLRAKPIWINRGGCRSQAVAVDIESIRMGSFDECGQLMNYSEPLSALEVVQRVLYRRPHLIQRVYHKLTNRKSAWMEVFEHFKQLWEQEGKPKKFLGDKGLRQNHLKGKKIYVKARKEERDLYSWICVQKYNYRTGKMKPYKIEKMNSINMDWTYICKEAPTGPENPSRKDDKWMRMYNKLKAWLEKDPTRRSDQFGELPSRELRQWVLHQRTWEKNARTNKRLPSG